MQTSINMPLGELAAIIRLYRVGKSSRSRGKRVPARLLQSSRRRCLSPSPLALVSYPRIAQHLSVPHSPCGFVERVPSSGDGGAGNGGAREAKDGNAQSTRFSPSRCCPSSSRSPSLSLKKNSTAASTTRSSPLPALEFSEGLQQQQQQQQRPGALARRAKTPRWSRRSAGYAVKGGETEKKDEGGGEKNLWSFHFLLSPSLSLSQKHTQTHTHSHPLPGRRLLQHNSD